MAYEVIGRCTDSEAGFKRGNALQSGYIKLTKRKRSKAKSKLQKQSRKKNRQ